ncbi:MULTISPECIES: hypothetical protein [Rhizobium]|uniref:Uncharacterized protein n=1 Tax=Rhizobium favelukesii TaxID=348824 RepID=W6R4N9_9HYPH|nr:MULTISPECIES: hypothetical protein [Rhizobium]MCS0463688.1 hypothetical protein [Rhizobium favelukesii]UFS82030.1 hypothetical protein LPB79_27735 [Rhizobium sp. T136]CDM56297.1 hypothetical protein LPU83_0615 [Rhizobium favelukesii]
MSEENKIIISPQVQLVETAAQKGFLEQRVLMLSQLLHDKADEVAALHRDVNERNEGNAELSRRVEDLTARLQAAETNAAEFERQLYLARNQPETTEAL